RWHDRAPRAAARCPHFGACGGCQLQHLPPDEIARWQCAQVATALARNGLGDCLIEPAPAMPAATRRRARLAFGRRGSRVPLGFRGRASRTITDLEACAVVMPEIEALVPHLRAALADLPLAKDGGEVLVTAAESGLDLLLVAAPEPVLQDREVIAGLAADQDLARVAWQRRVADEPEIIVQRRPVRVSFAGTLAELPPGAFLQATVEAETQIRAAVQAAIATARGGTGRLADLYAGCGTFALPLAAAGHRVHAVEIAPEMVTAFETAARVAGIGNRLTAEVRNLGRAPLAGTELDRLDAVILDPPRAGAQPQARMLAGSSVPRIVMVSCYPATFARDARVLVDGGYRLDSVQLIDAFLWSSRIELVASFSRPSRATPPRAKFGA
ncbi:MAG: class I SAM-dependent RNA methyltransferase, partial [Pseudomonadota bacterium]